ncbi:hypothetical protein CPY51_16090 [Rhizobium tubonense]|uniref:Uncharacterized protein n=1 Tax=Rhizobium tubonense TaxID=484088 RepID=A0A2W4CRS7_9HYPH|nr:hypothetical protein CPY51_16090 [Rhizobium tubonense]
MKIAGWVNSYTYSNKVYWHPLLETDPIARYSYKSTSLERDTVRRKIEVVAAIKRDLRAPAHVIRYVVRSMGDQQ